MKLWSLCLSIGMTFLLSVTECAAQNGLKTFDNKGTLVDVGDYQLLFKAKDGTEYTVYLDAEQLNFSYTGTADAKSLSPGMLVRFKGKFDAKGNPQEDLKELEIFLPKQNVRLNPEEELAQTPGVYPVGGEKPNGNAAANQAGANPDAKATAKDSKDSKAKNSKQKPASKSSDKKPVAKQGSEAQEYKIVGQIINAQSGKIQVSTGTQSFIVQVANAAKITVATPTADYCVPGDEVHVVGLTSTEQPKEVQARTIRISGAKPIGAQIIEVDDKKSKKPGSKSDPKKDPKADSKAGSDPKEQPKAGSKK